MVQRKIDAASELANRLLAELLRRRDAGVNYPCTPWEAGRSIQPDLAETALLAAIGKTPFKSKVLVAIAGDLSLPCAVKEDATKLAGDERVLRAFCGRLCSPESPLVDLKQAAKLLPTALRKPFVTIWESRLKSGDLPSFVDAAQIPGTGTGRGKKTSVNHLHDRRFVLPWHRASEAILRTIVKHRTGGDIICNWKDLVQSLSQSEDAKWLPVGRQTEPCIGRIVPVFPKQPDGWLVLAEDIHACAYDCRVIEGVFASLLKRGDNAIDLAALAKQKFLDPRIGTALASAVQKWSIDNQVPAPYALVRFGSKRLMVRAVDIQATAANRTPSKQTVQSPVRGLEPNSSQTSTVVSSRGEFARDFDDVFSQLDLAGGALNFVKLFDLRRALPQYSRQEFDSGLRALRVAMQYALEGSEGNRVTLSAEQTQAGIQEAGMNLVYCRRRR